ncbi:hypothetical protein HMPREF1870_02021 [Bacteroidales bacterium KA00344]|nr:hypothetical protein HMPREF1870_02021 [Bacteroidales bacterium KA00344]
MFSWNICTFAPRNGCIVCIPMKRVWCLFARNALISNKIIYKIKI